MSFSAGISLCPPYETLDSATGTADKALYEAKRQGRNRVVLAE